MSDDPNDDVVGVRVLGGALVPEIDDATGVNSLLSGLYLTDGREGL